MMTPKQIALYVRETFTTGISIAHTEEALTALLADAYPHWTDLAVSRWTHRGMGIVLGTSN